jgi:hypothetical protein
MRRLKHKKSRAGQAMVEWAIVLPALLICIFATCQWCLIEVAQNLTFDAAYRAARAKLVNENPFDAAYITLLPIGGWTESLKASGRNSGGAEVDMILPRGDGIPALPGWSDTQYRDADGTVYAVHQRSQYLQNRLAVIEVDNGQDWEEISYEVHFYYELLFPFVDLIFADMQQKHANLKGTVVDEEEQVGIASVSSEMVTGLRAKNFIELIGRGSVPFIDRPVNAGLTPVDCVGLQTAGPQLVTPGDPTMWEVEP